MAPPTFHNIILGGKADKPSGVLRLNEHGFGWKDPHGKSVTVLSKELKGATNVQVGPSSHQLILKVKNGKNVRFEGLAGADMQAITKYSSELLGLAIESKTPNTHGWNWGTTTFDGNLLEFAVDSQFAFALPLATVSQCQILKQEVSLEFHREEEAQLSETLTGITLWVPKDEDEEAGAPGLHKEIMSRADMLSTSGKAIVTLPQVGLKVPRGKYDLELYSSLVRFKGTQSFTVLYDNITRISWMKTTDERHFYIVLALHPPLRKGQTHYPHILFQIKEEASMEVELSLDEDEIKEKYGDSLQQNMSGSKFEVVLQVLRAITGKRITRRGNFESVDKLKAVRTSLKANDGYLYPMDKCFFFVPSPPTFIKYSSCTEVEFSRVSGVGGISSRTFDLVIFHSSNQTYVFKNIAKEEYEPLRNFLRSKKLNLKSDLDMDHVTQEQQMKMQMEFLGEDSDEDDDDFAAGDAVDGEGEEEEEDGDFDEDDDEEEEEEEEDEISADELNALQEELEEVGAVENYGKGKRKRAASKSPEGKRKAKVARTSEDDD